MKRILNSESLLIALGVAVLSGLVIKMVHKTRGLRNGNPGNIKEMPGDATQWVGERATDDDPVFEEFTDPAYGIRAIGRILRSYRARGILTVKQIIETWAPSKNENGEHENHTDKYLQFVLSRTGWLRIYAPQESRGDYVKLVAAIIEFENGYNPYSAEFIADSLAIS